MQAALLLPLLLPSVAWGANRTHGDGERIWVPRFLDEYPLAMCNDGSPGAYYFRPGTEGSRQWLVYLDAAGWCWDDMSCRHPWQILHGTSKYFPRTAKELRLRADKYLRSGILDPEYGPLAKAHVAYVKSCSNDAFMGNLSPTKPSSAPFNQRTPRQGWHFRGRQIVLAVFADLRRRMGLGNQSEDRVVYGGCSAGARGALVTLDHIAQTRSIVGQASVVGLLDSGFWVPAVPGHSSGPGWRSFEEQLKSAMFFANESAYINPECSKTFKGESWKCLMGSYILPFVRTPYFLVHSQYDLFAISMNLWGHYWPTHAFAPQELNWTEGYRRLVLQYLPNPPDVAESTIFSPACYMHCLITVPRYWTISADGILLSDTLKAWCESTESRRSTTTEEGPQKRTFRETCHGFNCGFSQQDNAIAQSRRLTSAVVGPAARGRRRAAVPAAPFLV